MPAERHYYDGWSDSHVATATITVHAQDDETPVWSGLYDARGVKLYRVPTRHPVGFHDFTALRKNHHSGNQEKARR